MTDRGDFDLMFHVQEALGWILNIAVFFLLYLIAAKVLKNLPALLNIITI